MRRNFINPLGLVRSLEFYKIYGITLWAQVLHYVPPLEFRNTLRLGI
jgi:hypothetical protein